MAERTGPIGGSWRNRDMGASATAFPSIVSAHAITRSDLDFYSFVRHATRAKWLSIETRAASFSTGTILVSGQMSLFGGVAGSDTLGYSMPWDATLVEVIASKAVTLATVTMQLRAGSTVKHTASMLAADEVYVADELDVDFAAGDVVNVNVTTALASGGSLNAIFRRRAT